MRYRTRYGWYSVTQCDTCVAAAKPRVPHPGPSTPRKSADANFKAFTRRAQALRGLHRWDDALNDLEDALAICPRTQQRVKMQSWETLKAVYYGGIGVQRHALDLFGFERISGFVETHVLEKALNAAGIKKLKTYLKRPDKPARTSEEWRNVKVECQFWFSKHEVLNMKLWICEIKNMFWVCHTLRLCLWISGGQAWPRRGRRWGRRGRGWRRKTEACGDRRKRRGRGNWDHEQSTGLGAT